MKYWENFLLAVGAGCFVGLIVNPASWLAGPFGILAVMFGYVFHRYGKEEK